MSEGNQCPRCGSGGPVAFVRQGEQRVGFCANQHKMTWERIGQASFAHERMSRWIKRLECSTWQDAVGY